MYNIQCIYYTCIQICRKLFGHKRCDQLLRVKNSNYKIEKKNSLLSLKTITYRVGKTNCII